MGVSALAMNGDLKTISDETIAELETAPSRPAALASLGGV